MSGPASQSLAVDRSRPLYSDVIRQRWRHPRFQGDLPGASLSGEAVNPLCGDRVRVLLRVDGQRVQAVRHRGDACAICVASADLLAERIEGGPLAAAAAIGPADLLAALAADIRPARLRCVTLPLSALAAALGPEAGRQRSS